MNRILALSFFLLTFFSVNAQKLLSETEINRLVSETLSSSKQNLTVLKDSVEFYGFAIELEVSRKNQLTKVNKISLNDSVGYMIYDDFDFLKKINYTSILKDRKSAKIVIPVGIIIAYVKNPIMAIPLLKAEEMMPKLAKLFNKDFKNNNQLSKFIYLDPIICLCSTKVYD